MGLRPETQESRCDWLRSGSSRCVCHPPPGHRYSSGTAPASGGQRGRPATGGAPPAPRGAAATPTSLPRGSGASTWPIPSCPQPIPARPQCPASRRPGLSPAPGLYRSKPGLPPTDATGGSPSHAGRCSPASERGGGAPARAGVRRARTAVLLLYHPLRELSPVKCSFRVDFLTVLFNCCIYHPLREL